jgi:hypothetical protein
MKRGVLAALALFVATGAHAEQRRQRPPSSPSTPVAPAPVLPPGAVIPQAPLIPGPVSTPAPRTPFDARPGTYAPRYNDPRSRYGAAPYYSGAVGIGEYVPAAEPPSPDQKPPAALPPPETPRAPASTPATDAPKVASLHPDTFYVIPGCYAGNHPPRPARLPKGCDPAKLQEIPIR